MHKMNAAIFQCTGALMFFSKGEAADPEVTGLKSCGTVLLWASENGGYWFRSMTALQGTSYSMSNYRKPDILQDVNLNDLIGPSGLKSNQSCFRHIKCGITSD